MDLLVEFFVSAGASIAAYYVCKWLDRHAKGQEARNKMAPRELPLSGGRFFRGEKLDLPVNFF